MNLIRQRRPQGPIPGALPPTILRPLQFTHWSPTAGTAAAQFCRTNDDGNGNGECANETLSGEESNALAPPQLGSSDADVAINPTSSGDAVALPPSHDAVRIENDARVVHSVARGDRPDGEDEGPAPKFAHII